MAQLDDKGKSLDMALGQIEKQFGKGSIMRMGDNVQRRPLRRTLLPRRNETVASVPISMPNTQWTRSTHEPLVSTLMIF